MKKYYLTYEKDGSISASEMEVEAVFRFPFEYRAAHGHMYKILSPGQYQGEVWCWWAFCEKEEIPVKAQKMFDEQLQQFLKKFLLFLDLIINDKLNEKHKWRL